MLSFFACHNEFAHPCSMSRGAKRRAGTNGGRTEDTAMSASMTQRTGLYDPRNEHDACGVGFIADMKGVKSHQIVADGLAMLENLTHRGAVGADPLMGDGAGVLVQIPDTLLPRGNGQARHRPCRSLATMPSAISSCRATPALRAHIEGIIARGRAGRGPAADRLPRRAGRQCLAFEGAAHCRLRTRATARCSSAAPRTSTNDDDFERRLYVLRKVISNRDLSRRRTAATTASTSCRCRRAPSSTRACSSPTRSATTTRT